MLIGIDASRAFITQRTGVEEYSHQIIKRLIPLLSKDQVVLYVRNNQSVDFILPENWKIKKIKQPYLWTQIGLSLELLFHSVDVLFVPAHTVPLVHPKNTIVVIHGLEYEFCPEAYSFQARLYMRWSIKNSCRWAKKIVAVSENTKKDLMKLYRVLEDKIEVIYEGYNGELRTADYKLQNRNILNPYLLFVGRLEERKNIVGIIKTFEILKEQYKLSHKLVLAGNFGYGKEKIQESISNSNFKKDIILPGYISESEKWEILKNADVFLFPTFYEGFGIPILEAQSVGVPVVAGDNSSMPEITEKSAILVDSKNAEQIANAVYKIITDEAFKEDIIEKGYKNAERFSWEKCANEIAKILTK
jgi:glycosyltransferase involved in cell wall biosynthesis